MCCYSECKNADCHFAECCIFIVMLSVMLSVVNAQCRIFIAVPRVVMLSVLFINLSVAILNVVKLGVIMLNVAFFLLSRVL